MKALLLADLYQSKKHLRQVLLLVVVFSVVTVVNTGNMNAMFFPIYAMLMASLLSMSLIAYDEQSNWILYAQAMPCTRRQQVTEKYIVSLMGIGAVWLLFTVIFILKAAMGSLAWGEVPFRSLVLLAIGLFGPCPLLPVVFRYGVTKGRLVYFGMIMLAAAMGAGLLSLGASDTPLTAVFSMPGWLLGAILTAVMLALFFLSWRLAIRWYEKREL